MAKPKIEWIIEIPPINLINFNRLRYWMLGYKDMTFCADECGNKECFRRITDKVLEDGKRWWGSEDFPMYQANFKHTCGQWKEKEDE